MAKWINGVTDRLPQGVAGCFMFGVFLAVWLRALDAVAGRTIYTSLVFWVMVVAALGLGALLAWPCRRLRYPEVLLGALYLLTGGCLVAELAGFSFVTETWQRLLVTTERTVASYFLTLCETAFFTVSGPAVLAGLAVFLFLRVWRRDFPGRSVATCIGWGAVSVVVGYGVGPCLVPLLGVEDVTRLAALWFGALASLSFFGNLTKKSPGLSVLSCAPFVAVIGASVVFSPAAGGPSFLSDGVFARFVHRDSGFAQGRPLFEHSSRRHTVAMFADPDYQFVFALDGRPILFGNRFHTARTLTGYVPLLVRPSCGKALLVGPEAGVYLPFFVRGGVTNVAVAETERAVLNLAVAADAFVTGDDTCEKKALQWDAELKGDSRYDVIYLTPEPAWMRGSKTLFGRRVFERCSQALSGDGIAALHLDARALSPERFAAIAADFSAVFPGVQVWCTGPSDWVLVGCAKEIKTPVDRMLSLFDRTSVFRDFVRAGEPALPETLACVLCDGKGLLPWLSHSRKESAWHAEWSSVCRLFEKEPFALQPATLEACRQWKAQWILPGETDVDVYLAVLDRVGRNIGGRVAAVTALAEMAKNRREAELGAAREAAEINPHDALLIHLSEVAELEGRRRLKLNDHKGAMKCFESLLSFSKDSAFAHYGMGLCLRGTRDNEGAYLHFARAVAYAPAQVDYRLEMAQSALAVGRFDEADRQYAEVLKREPNNPAVLFLAAKALVWRERPLKNTAQALKMAERACVLTKWENGEYAFGLADLYIDAGRVLEGMGLKRRLKEGFKTKVP